jgi:RNA polymerase sigma-70 factor (ECF subfamily)
MAALDEFEASRERLFGIAYRMTGSVADADDIVQDAWLRWERTDTTVVDNSEAWLVRTTTNLAIDRSRLVARRREDYVGPFLPEPIVEALDANDPQLHNELTDSLTFAFLVMLDELEPLARAVLLLHDVFGYSFDEIAPMVDRNAAACRQIASRTRRRLAEHRVELRTATEEHERRMLNELVHGLLVGDVERIVALLSPDVVQIDDGGPHRRAARHAIVGAERVSRFLVNLAKRVTPSGIDFVRVNGQPGMVIRVDDRPDIVACAEFAPDGRIRRIFAQLNPDKLTHLG